MVSTSGRTSSRRAGMMDWANLITISRLLATPQPPNTQPLQDSLRRAVSTAYYAMFHALAGSNADCLIGTPGNPVTRHAWHRVYRGLEHRDARRNTQQDQNLFSPPVVDFADTFAQLQRQRHIADYDPSQPFTLSATQNWIDQAEQHIIAFMQLSTDERRAVAIQSLIRRRTEN